MSDSLEDALARLDVTTDAVTPSSTHWLPDIVALGYLTELRENAAATVALVGAVPPLHAMPSARAAFEAGQNLLLLVTAPDLDYAGALAYVYGLKKDHDIMVEHASALPGTPPEEQPGEWIDKALEEVARTWEILAKGKGRLVHDAAAELTSRWHRKPDNWAGLNPASELGRRLAVAGFCSTPSAHEMAAIFRATYRTLNRDTHPRTVVRPLGVERSAAGVVRTVLEYRDKDQTARVAHTIAAGAVNLGIRAFLLRGAIH